MFIRVHDTDQWMYRNGGFALIALAGAGVILAASHPSLGLTQRLLRPRPMQFVGLISYGLYLWHWPVNVFVSPDRFGLHGSSLLACRIALTFAISILSYYLLEIPVRSGRLKQFKPRLTGATAGLVTAGLLVASTAGAPSALVSGDGTAQPAPDSKRAVIVPRSLPASSAPSSTTALPSNRGDEPTAAPPAPPDRDPLVAIVGDSVGWTMVWRAPLIRGLTLRTHTDLGCGVVTGKYISEGRIVFRGRLQRVEGALACGGVSAPRRGAGLRRCLGGVRPPR